VVLLGGGVALGAAVGDEFGDDDDDRPSMSDGPRGDEDRDGQPGDDRGGDRDDDGQRPSQGGGPVTGIGTDSADELVAIAEAARGAAEGDVTSIDAKRDGTWEVQLTGPNGSETEVRVDADLEATVISTEEDDDSAPANTLDEATIRALVDAALAETDGMITDLDVDNDEVSPYDASVLTEDNRSVDIDFGADFAVVGTDTDD
ncbi:PepSY domain-containing protein, partial [uncultured Microbacterium sp.]|uniref:PepSY domain-containing protein n=1 Tax=uncultured Microbacterium sp. TaxID=191216 RepID=UPI0028D58202